MVTALKPPLLGSFTEGTRSREGTGRWVCGGSSHVIIHVERAVWQLTYAGEAVIINESCLARMNIIIRNGLISYQSHSNSILSSDGNKTQQGLSTDHTTSKREKHKGSWMGCSNTHSCVLFRTDRWLIYNLVWSVLNVAFCCGLTRSCKQTVSHSRISKLFT